MKEQSIWESIGLVIFYQSKEGDFFGKAGIILARGRFLWQSEEEFWQGREISFAKQEISLTKSEISVPNLTFEREEEIKGVDFGGQTFARP